MSFLTRAAMILAGLGMAHALTSPAVQRVPVVPLAGKVHLPMERVSLLAMGRAQLEIVRAIEASGERLFAIQVADAPRPGMLDSIVAPTPVAGDVYVLCELLSTHRTRGYSSQHTATGAADDVMAVEGVSGTALAIGRCRVERLVSHPGCEETTDGERPCFATVDVQAVVDVNLEASAGVLEFDKLLDVHAALDAVTDGVVHDALVAKAEKQLWSYIVDCKHLVERLGLVDADEAEPSRRSSRKRTAPSRRRRSASVKFDSPGTWLQEDPFEVMSALAPKMRSAAQTESREGRAATRQQRRKVVLERSWRMPSSMEKPQPAAPSTSPDAAHPISRAELFSFAVAATLSSEDLEGTVGLKSRRDVLASTNTLERLETCVNCMYQARSFLAARNSVASLFKR